MQTICLKHFWKRHMNFIFLDMDPLLCKFILFICLHVLLTKVRYLWFRYLRLYCVNNWKHAWNNVRSMVNMIIKGNDLETKNEGEICRVGSWSPVIRRRMNKVGFRSFVFGPCHTICYIRCSIHSPGLCSLLLAMTFIEIASVFLYIL